MEGLCVLPKVGLNLFGPLLPEKNPPNQKNEFIRKLAGQADGLWLISEGKCFEAKSKEENYQPVLPGSKQDNQVLWVSILRPNPVGCCVDLTSMVFSYSSIFLWIWQHGKFGDPMAGPTFLCLESSSCLESTTAMKENVAVSNRSAGKKVGFSYSGPN